MNALQVTDRYWKEVLEVSTRKHDIKGSVSLRYKSMETTLDNINVPLTRIDYFDFYFETL